MNKTVSANLSGIIFNMDEEAYVKLQRYLDKIRSYFSASEGRDEIMADIEARIAELFEEQTSAGKQVIGMPDVDRVIEAMGQPEDFAEVADEEAAEQASRTERPRGKRKGKTLYRDPDRKVVGGVCGGLGHYFGTDPLWFRLLFLGVFFLGGGGLIFYIVLWVIVPEASTTAEKLEMQGEPVTIDSISKKVEEGIDSLGKRFDNVDTDRMASNAKSGIERLGNAIINLLRLLIEGLGKIIGIAFIAGGVLALILLLLGFLGYGTFINLNPSHIDPFSLRDFAGIFFQSDDQQTLVLLGLLLVAGIPMLGLVTGGIRLLLGYKRSWKGISLGLLVLWLCGVGMISIAALEVNEEFDREVVLTETIRIPALAVDSTASDSAVVPDILDIRLGNDVFETRRHKRYRNNSDFRAKLDDGQLFLGSVRLDVVESQSDTFRIKVHRVAEGASTKDAKLRARDIAYNYRIDYDRVWFDPYLTMDPELGWRDQEVDIIIEVPKGKAVHFSPGTERIIFDIDNVTDTYDREMVGRTWTMTDEGLECLGCEFDERGRITDYDELKSDPAVYFRKDAQDGSTTLIID